MQNQIETLIDSLALPSPQAHSLRQLQDDPAPAAVTSRSDANPHSISSLACRTLQIGLGVEVVETTPLPPESVDANWSVLYND